VHNLRTQMRRIEAIACAFQLEQKAVGTKLLKELKPIRKAAGHVRDMDVLVGFASTLTGEEECRVQLLEDLGVRRVRNVSKLHKAVDSHQQDALDYLKRCLRLAEDGLESPAASRSQAGQKKSADSAAASMQLGKELRDWPNLSAKNIHPYRLKVKELRNVLQLAEQPKTKFSSALGRVKDQIGTWHDWDELAQIADRLFGRKSTCKIATQIQSRSKEELERALKTANAFRNRYFLKESPRAGGKKFPRAEMKAPVFDATSRLAS